jgi:hypothetical protein
MDTVSERLAFSVDRLVCCACRVVLTNKQATERTQKIYLVKEFAQFGQTQPGVPGPTDPEYICPLPPPRDFYSAPKILQDI